MWPFKTYVTAAQNQNEGSGAWSPFGSCGCEGFGKVDGISSMCHFSLWDSNDRSIQGVPTCNKEKKKLGNRAPVQEIN